MKTFTYVSSGLPPLLFVADGTDVVVTSVVVVKILLKVPVVTRLLDHKNTKPDVVKILGFLMELDLCPSFLFASTYVIVF